MKRRQFMMAAAAGSISAYAPSEVIPWRALQSVFDGGAGEVKRGEWPRLESRLAHSRKGELTQHVSLSQAVLAFVSRELDRPAAPAHDLGVLLAQSRAISLRGGYTNEVINDTLRRVAILIASRQICRGARIPQVVSELRSSSTGMEEIMALEQSLLTSEKQNNNSPPLLSALEVNPASVMSRLPGLKTRTSELLSGLSIDALVWRKSESETAARLLLPALNAFIERGGRLEELERKDMLRYEQIMGEALADFQDESLGFGVVLPSHLLPLIPTSAGAQTMLEITKG
jgi:hypothetical protein